MTRARRSESPQPCSNSNPPNNPSHPLASPRSRAGAFLLRPTPRHILAHVRSHVLPIAIRVCRAPCQRSLDRRFPRLFSYGLSYGTGLSYVLSYGLSYGFSRGYRGQSSARSLLWRHGVYTCADRLAAPYRSVTTAAFLFKPHSFPASLNRCRACASMRALTLGLPRPCLCQLSLGRNGS